MVKLDIYEPVTIDLECECGSNETFYDMSLGAGVSSMIKGGS